jgi:2-polyprenyl-3-methyl-5-hydroxy-6-metoxy-1,4-benzoquinol methylase
MSTISDIILAYDSPIVRAYAMVRFRILRQRFLTEIGQYLPERGHVVDIGCGFGLFTMFFASTGSHRQIHGFDINERRIGMARTAAEKLKIANATFEIGDARHLQASFRFDAVYMLDIIHHIPRQSVPELVNWARSHLSPGGVMLIKDVADRPFYKRWFTLALDKLMDYHAPVDYWSPDDLMALVRSHGFIVYVHSMVDYLPYPHILYICRLPAESRPESHALNAPI